MLPEHQQIVSPERFSALFSEQALIAEFPNQEAESDYERRDAFLIHLIRREVDRIFASGDAEKPFVNDDWWPDHTRHVEADLRHCTPAFFEALHALLIDDYGDWRIQLCICDGRNFLGSLVLYAESILMEERLHSHLAHNGVF
jgi:hypothetical protein